MEITLLRDSILGVGKIDYTKTFHRPSNKFVPDMTRAGRVTKLNSGVRGDVVDLPEATAERLIGLGSALIGSHKKENLPTIA